MTSLERGTIVFSKRGRDKGRAMLVLAVEDEYLQLVDGKLRTLDRPKKKKAKHIQPTNFQVDMQINDGRKMQDADIRKWIKLFVVQEGGKKHCRKTM